MINLDLYDLDIADCQAQLAGDNGQIYLFQWLAALEKNLRGVAVVSFHCFHDSQMVSPLSRTS